MPAAARIVVEGDVQGVGYRYFVLRQAQVLELNGYVRNLADGGVEIVAEGEKSAIEQLVDLAKRGPRLAKVDNMKVEWKESMGIHSYFGIR
jgi:acylphosphatase